MRLIGYLAEGEKHDRAKTLERFCIDGTPVDVFVSSRSILPKNTRRLNGRKSLKVLKRPLSAAKHSLLMKRLAARPQDLADIAELEQIQKLRKAGQDD